MPTMFLFRGFRVVIYPKDHRPAHVHVTGAGAEAIFLRHCPNGPIELQKSYRFKVSLITQIANGLAGRIADLWSKWRHLHGDY